MLIDGNDTRGIDTGIMTTTAVEIIVMRRNVDEPDPATGDELFCRDCAEYNCRLPSGVTVWVLLNHFKSQIRWWGTETGSPGSKGPRHRRRTHRWGEHNIVVIGDLNEGPAVEGQPAANLTPLFEPNSPLVDLYSLPSFDPGASGQAVSADEVCWMRVTNSSLTTST